MSLFVGKLDPSIPLEEVKEMFKKHGALKRFDHRETFCFVSYEDMAAADEAIKTLQDAAIGNSKINIEWTRESGRYAENRPRDNGSQPRIRTVERQQRRREALPLPPPSSRSEYRTTSLDDTTTPYRPRSRSPPRRSSRSRSRSVGRRGGDVCAECRREGHATADCPQRMDRLRRGSPKRITLRRDRDSRERDRERDRDRDRDGGSYKRRDDSIERDVRDMRKDRDLRDGRDVARNGRDRRDDSRERPRDRDDRPAYRDDRDRDRDRDRERDRDSDRGYERDRPRSPVRRDSYDRGATRARSRSPVNGHRNGSDYYRGNGRSRSRSRPRSPRHTPAYRSPSPLRRSVRRSRSVSPVNGNGRYKRRSPSPVRRSRS